jgi:hypothetical protein
VGTPTWRRPAARSSQGSAGPVDEPDRRSSLELSSNVGPVAEQGETRNDHEIGRVQVLAVQPWKDAIAAFQGDGKHVITRD